MKKMHLPIIQLTHNLTEEQIISAINQTHDEQNRYNMGKLVEWAKNQLN